jgi:tetratricopeptide (TPR) repeat protein
LILASLSKPEQALAYIENALRANPDSKAAHKAIRLVYSQMKTNEKASTEEKSERSFADNSSIPIPSPAETAKEKEPEQSKAEIEPALPSSRSRKEIFLNRLRGSGVTPAASAVLPEEAPEPKRKIMLSKKHAHEEKQECRKSNLKSKSLQ